MDKSKSTKTVVMELLAASGNTDVEGATVVNACYGGTAALLNAFLWVESEGWDGRYALVVAADIAAYARGPARPTCGVGAVAVLVGRDAPLVADPRLRATHAAHVWDFFKPDHTVEYPTVDGALSQVCYYQALEDTYTRFCDKMEKYYHGNTQNNNNGKKTSAIMFDATTPDYFCFHAPYNKLVQKSYARLFLLDARRRHAAAVAAGHDKNDEEKKELVNSDKDADSSEMIDQQLQAWLETPIEDTYADKALEKVLKNVSAAAYKQKLNDSNAASIDVGNTYTASVFLGLASLVDRAANRGDLNPSAAEKSSSIVMFSYGSGALATMYHLQV